MLNNRKTIDEQTKIKLVQKSKRWARRLIKDDSLDVRTQIAMNWPELINGELLETLGFYWWIHPTQLKEAYIKIKKELPRGFFPSLSVGYLTDLLLYPEIQIFSKEKWFRFPIGNRELKTEIEGLEKTSPDLVKIVNINSGVHFESEDYEDFGDIIFIRKEPSNNWQVYKRNRFSGKVVLPKNIDGCIAVPKYKPDNLILVPFKPKNALIITFLSASKPTMEIEDLSSSFRWPVNNFETPQNVQLVATVLNNQLTFALWRNQATNQIVGWSLEKNSNIPKEKYLNFPINYSGKERP